MTKNDGNNAEWSYNHLSNMGPSSWKYLCSAYSKCGGKSQSPINIVNKDVLTNLSLPKLQLSYSEVDVDVEYNNHTYQFNVEGDNILKLNGPPPEATTLVSTLDC